ncbi:MAG: hypothetical protein HWQ38_01545 [Nostoc sp. NMS7]|uniref:hypothetical protein n=1 Tax=Nostoc sp. NMS7 TaxID=2815391 RepID=UPI0025D18EA1|nr:hypothetical protein [Nostoc sp. NMS7]MBN3945229.1 hypothetical protein [Nostoc sp. NMS7]
MTAANPFAESMLQIAQEQVANATQEAQEIQLKADKATRIQKLLENITMFAIRGWILHVLNVINKEKTLLDEMRHENHPAITLLNEIFEISQKKAASIKLYISFPSELEKACATANLSLDRDAHHPNYKFERGFFQLYIDDQKKTAKLSNFESNKLFNIPADIEAVVEAIQQDHKRIFDRPFDDKKFLKKLRSHYLAILKANKQKDGASVPIRHITRRLGKNEKGFRTDEFLIDLSRLVEKGELEIDGWRMDCQQTKDTTQGMYLHIEPKRYIGSLVFKKV